MATNNTDGFYWRFARRRISSLSEDVRKHGVLPVLVLGAVPAIALFLFGMFWSDVQSWAKGVVTDAVFPPSFTVAYSTPVHGSLTVKVWQDDGPEKTVFDLDSRHFKVRGGPANYWINLVRIRDGQKESLQKLVEIPHANKVFELNTEVHWDPTAALEYLPGPKPLSIALSDTRFNAVNDDYALATGEGSALERKILTNALNQVGTSYDDEAVQDYWSVVPELERHRKELDMPWGGAMLGWIVAQSGATPPPHSASFLSWTTWGSRVPTSAIRPGMIAVFQLVGEELPQARSRLLVGVILRKQGQCIQVVIGNIASKVAITCVHRKLLDVRSALPTRA